MGSWARWIASACAAARLAVQDDGLLRKLDRRWTLLHLPGEPDDAEYYVGGDGVVGIVGFGCSSGSPDRWTYVVRECFGRGRWQEHLGDRGSAHGRSREVPSREEEVCSGDSGTIGDGSGFFERRQVGRVRRNSGRNAMALAGQWLRPPATDGSGGTSGIAEMVARWESDCICQPEAGRFVEAVSGAIAGRNARRSPPGSR